MRDNLFEVSRECLVYGSIWDWLQHGATDLVKIYMILTFLILLTTLPFIYGMLLLLLLLQGAKTDSEERSDATGGPFTR